MKSVVRGFIILVVLGLALTYLGILRSATSEFEVYGDLERLQLSRMELSSAGSGFGQDIDVSTTEGAILAIPIGFIYLMFAPFPWQVDELQTNKHITGCFYLVGFDPVFIKRTLVYYETSFPKLYFDINFYGYANLCLFNFPRKCRNGLSPADTNTGLSVYFCCCRDNIDGLNAGKTLIPEKS